MSLSRRRVSGFTLIEMIVMIIIIAIMAGIAVPSYERLKSQSTFQTSVEQVLAMLASARESAIDTNADVVLQFDPQANTFTMQIEQPDSNQDMPAALQTANNDQSGNNATIESLGREVAITDWQKDQSVGYVQEPVLSNSSNSGLEVRFHEDGSSDSLKFVIRGADDNFAVIQLVGSTGRASQQ